MGSPHSNHNYPQNPQNNARQGGNSKDSSQGDKFTLTSQKGSPLPSQMPQISQRPGVISQRPGVQVARGPMQPFVDPRFIGNGLGRRV